ncbi:hypothetical protein GF340_04850 [Candidatus Peregrinibacteria bacterium]|nr:hypothetical protein [Candidatus Peregrinibacteria bacterium]
MTTLPQKISESMHPRRTITPDGGHMRHQFNETFNHLILESYAPDEIDPETGDYYYTQPEVRKYLGQDLNTLANSDPLIKLSLLIEKGEIDPENADTYITTYKLVWPNIKSCNDLYFGQIDTNELIAKLQTMVRKELHIHGVHGLHTSFKGGVLTIEVVSESEPGLNQSLIDCLNQIEENSATQIFLPKTISQITALTKEVDKYNEKIKNVEKYKKENSDKWDDEKEQILLHLIEQSKQIQKNIDYLLKLKNDLSSNNRCQVNFGFASLADNANRPFIAIRNSECAANMAKEKQDCNYAKYSHNSFLLLGLVSAAKVQATVLNETTAEIKPEWADFFTKDKNGNVRMSQQRIRQYRKLDKYFESNEFQSLSDSEQEAEKSKFTFFGKYFRAINTADVVKPYTVANLRHYLEDVQMKVTVINEADAILNNPLEASKLRKTWKDLLPIMKLSAKAKSVEHNGDANPNLVIGNTRSLIAKLRCPGLKLYITGDHTDFGVSNVQEYEATFLELLRLMQDTGVTKKDIEENNLRFREFVDSTTFLAKLLSFGDAGSLLLRNAEQKLHKLVGGKLYINADGGDELIAILDFDSEHMLPSNNKDIATVLSSFATANNMRVAAYKTTLSLDPISNSEIRMKTTPINQGIRTNIVPWIRLLELDEEAHKDLKHKAERNIRETNVSTYNEQVAKIVNE